MNAPTIIVLAVVAALAGAVVAILSKKESDGCTNDKSKCPTCDKTDCPLKKGLKK